MDNGPLEIDPLDAPAPAPGKPPVAARGDAVDPEAGDEDTKREQAGYTSSGERCSTCEYFSSDELKCNKFDFEAEPDGHCLSWEAPDGADNEATEKSPTMGAPGPEPDQDDLDPFE